MCVITVLFASGKAIVTLVLELSVFPQKYTNLRGSLSRNGRYLHRVLRASVRSRPLCAQCAAVKRKKKSLGRLGRQHPTGLGNNVASLDVAMPWRNRSCGLWIDCFRRRVRDGAQQELRIFIPEAKSFQRYSPCTVYIQVPDSCGKSLGT